MFGGLATAVPDKPQSNYACENAVCKHVDFVKRKFVEVVLRITHQDALEPALDICYIPGCQKSENLGIPSLMGNPPIKTVPPINFIGVGLKTERNFHSMLDSWYVSYLPINFYSMGKDLYNISMRIVDIIGSGKLFKDDKIDRSFQLPWNPNSCVFTTPSCAYASLDELASMLDYPKIGCKLQLVLQILQKPNTYSVNKRTLFYETHADRGKDRIFQDSEIEWHSNSIDSILPLRLLVRILPPKAQTFAEKNGLRPPLPIHIPVFNANSDVKLVDKVETDKSQQLNVYLSIPVYSGDQGLELVREESFKKLKGCIKSTDVNVQWYTKDFDCKNVVDYVITSYMDGMANGLSLEDPQYGILAVNIPWCSEQNRILFYFKSLLNSRRVEWCVGEKIWKVPAIHIYTVVKFIQHIGGSISDAVMCHVERFLSQLKGRSLAVYDEINNTSVWKYKHVIIASTGKKSQLNFTFYPFDKGIVELAKRCKMKWNKNINLWELQVSQISQFISLLKRNFDTILPLDKLDSFSIQFGCKIDRVKINDRISTVNTGVNAGFVEKEASNRVFGKRKKNEVTCILITAAGKEPHLHRICNKMTRIVNSIMPPKSSIDESGNLIVGGPGTGGIKFIQSPRGSDEWNQISFCVIPAGDKIDEILSRYDQNIMCSLVSEVFIITEKALDWLLDNCIQWPGPDESIKYKQWNEVMVDCEGVLWDGHTFNSRQQLAQERLFCDEEFYLVGKQDDHTVKLCKLLIQLGNGKIVSNPKHAEYVVITDNKSEEALMMKSKFANNDEDLISRTHGARHSTLVTPKFIYDCITTWKLQRPSRGQKHLAF